jgi:signal peptidase I
MAQSKAREDKPTADRKATDGKAADDRGAAAGNKAAAEKPAAGALTILREWADALVIAFLLAMFIRTFVVELFKIPSGSMTPTLVGTALAGGDGGGELVMECDYNNDGEKDLILENRNPRGGPRYHVFYRHGGKFSRANEELPVVDLPLEVRRKARARNDRIIVNKFVYWFREPRRGEIAVFRVPPAIYERDKPIFIKRVVGLPGETVAIRQPDLLVDGEVVTTPSVFRRVEYVNAFQYGSSPQGPDYRPKYIDWELRSDGRNTMDFFKSATVPAGHYLMFGDNSRSSRDGRDWGAVPANAIKGMAVFRYWPIDTLSFLE